jgi:hypothetical protein
LVKSPGWPGRYTEDEEVAFPAFLSQVVVPAKLYNQSSAGLIMNRLTTAVRLQNFSLRVTFAAFGAGVLLVCSTGCTTLFGRRGGPGDDLDLSQIKRDGYTVGPNGVMQAMPSDETSVVLEVVDGKRHFEKIPLIQGQPMFIADVVKDADLRKKLGPIHVRILRPNGQGAPVRMDVDFDESGKRVKDGTNYSLRPGDHIVVMKDDRGFASQMLSKTPLSGIMR